MNKVHFSSNNQTWGTPKGFFQTLNEEFHFALDPCCTKETAKCDKYYTEEMDGLSLSWECGGAVFCNPPYGRELKKWVEKAYEEAQKGVTVVMLIPARTDTSYFHDFIYKKQNCVLFVAA